MATCCKGKRWVVGEKAREGGLTSGQGSGEVRIGEREVQGEGSRCQRPEAGELGCGEGQVQRAREGEGAAGDKAGERRRNPRVWGFAGRGIRI